MFWLIARKDLFLSKGDGQAEIDIGRRAAICRECSLASHLDGRFPSMPYSQSPIAFA
jgi:hypothetical protein